MRYNFADCSLDVAAHELRRGGAPVHVEPQVFDLILCLARAEGALVSYDDLISEVWQGRIVSDATLAARISAARAAVGDDGKRQAVIRTVPRRGVQLAVPVASDSASGPVADGLRQVIRYTESADGTGIAWAETGAGPPILRGGHWLSHLEHDWSCPVWRPLLEFLARDRRLVRYDPRGTGLSDRCDLSGATLDRFVDDLLAVADAARLDRFPIFATSQSVPISLVFAARHPDRVSRMVLLNGYVLGPERRSDAVDPAALMAMIRSGWGVHGSAFMRAFATVFMPGASSDQIDSLVEMQALSASPETATQLRARIGEMDCTEVLDRVRCPVLILHSTGDAVHPADQSKILARRLQDAEFHLLESENHIVVPTDPAWPDVAQAVERFLAAEPAAA